MPRPVRFEMHVGVTERNILGMMQFDPSAR